MNTGVVQGQNELAAGPRSDRWPSFSDRFRRFYPFARTDSASSPLESWRQPERNVGYYHEGHRFSVDPHLCVLPLPDGHECGPIETFALRPEYASMSNRTGRGDAQLEENHPFVAGLKRFARVDGPHILDFLRRGHLSRSDRGKQTDRNGGRRHAQGCARSVLHSFIRHALRSEVPVAADGQLVPAVRQHFHHGYQGLSGRHRGGTKVFRPPAHAREAKARRHVG